MHVFDLYVGVGVAKMIPPTYSIQKRPEIRAQMRRKSFEDKKSILDGGNSALVIGF